MDSFYCDDYETLVGAKPAASEVVTKVIAATDPQVETVAVEPPVEPASALVEPAASADVLAPVEAVPAPDPTAPQAPAV